MKDNPMKVLYKYFGEQPEEDQEMFSVANVFYEMGQEQKEELDIQEVFQSSNMEEII